VKVNTGDRVTIRARGEWSYSPFVGLHGPEGGNRPSPGTYPLPNLPGGVLLGRIGEAGQSFYVGRGTTYFAEDAGTLYLRINDDLLGDNVGQLRLDVSIIPAPVQP
jgi:hypothetical protein